MTMRLDENHPVVGSAVGALRDHTSGCAGARHQGERPDTLGVVDADNRLVRKVVGTEPERPYDAACLVSLYDAVVELVGNQEVAGLVELPTEAKVLSRDGIGHQQESRC